MMDSIRKSITAYFIIFIISIVILSLGFLFLAKNQYQYLVSLLLISAFIFYQIVDNCIKYYSISKLIQTLRKNKIPYKTEVVRAEIIQESFDMIFTYNAKIPMPFENRQIKALISENFIVFNFMYKKYGFYNKVSFPLLINLKNDSNLSLKHVKEIPQENIVKENNNIVINSVGNFSKIILYGVGGTPDTVYLQAN